MYDFPEPADFTSMRARRIQKKAVINTMPFSDHPLLGETDPIIRVC